MRIKDKIAMQNKQVETISENIRNRKILLRDEQHVVQGLEISLERERKYLSELIKHASGMKS